MPKPSSEGSEWYGEGEAEAQIRRQPSNSHSRSQAGPPAHVHLGPQRVPSLGKRVFADVVQTMPSQSRAVRLRHDRGLRPLEPRELGRQEGPSPAASEGNGTLPTLTSDICPPGLRENQLLLFSASQAVVSSPDRPGSLSRHLTAHQDCASVAGLAAGEAGGPGSWQGRLTPGTEHASRTTVRPPGCSGQHCVCESAQQGPCRTPGHVPPVCFTQPSPLLTWH